MNWYKKSFNVQETIKNVMKGMAITVVPLGILLSFLHLSDADFLNILKKYNGDTAAARKYVEDKARYEINKMFNHEKFTGHIKQYEGFRNAVYDDGAGNATIGVGHLITPKSRQIFQQLFGNSVDFDAIVSGQAKLTNEQVNQLAKYDIDKHLKRARGIFPKFDTYPYYVKEALLNSVYRGDTGPKTVALINAGRWEEAAAEYVNRDDYNNAVSRGMSGIKTRMDANKSVMLEYAKQLKG